MSDVRIGLEVHVRLATATKLFSSAPHVDDAPPNTAVDAWSIAEPGVLPVLDPNAVRLALRAAVAIGADVAPVSAFDRKHYVYPDLPKGYQVTQRQPFATGGAVVVPIDGQEREVPVRSLHIEEDAAAAVHDADATWLDYNRVSTPLIEVVTPPVLDSPRLAARFARALRDTLRAAGVTHGHLHLGHVRCDVNVSVVGGQRVEIKNLNSFRHVARAARGEIARQRDAIARGEPVEGGTRHYDAVNDVTEPLRDKPDYRWLYEPDLPAIHVSGAQVDAARAALPELPHQARRRLARAGVSADDARTIASDPSALVAFDRALAAGAPAERVAVWLVGPVASARNTGELAADLADLDVDGFAAILSWVAAGRVTENAARAFFERWLEEGGPAAALADEAGLFRAVDAETCARAALDAAPELAARLRAGEHQLLDVLLGRALRDSGGVADPAALRAALRALSGLDD